MKEQERPRVLCVDDEPRVVEGLVLHLRKDYEVHTALSGDEGLKALKKSGGAAVVISDMRMPGMDGALFLHPYSADGRARAGCSDECGEQRPHLQISHQAVSAGSAEGSR
jgi:CheY-like chemotaxis protein